MATKMQGKACKSAGYLVNALKIFRARRREDLLAVSKIRDF